MSADLSRVQLELLRPNEIAAALAQRSLVYVPLGSVEYHAQHLPVGLDGLTAHGVCLRAAARSGGIVYPVVYTGTGGGHTSYPWTVMIDDTDLRAVLDRLLDRLEQFGVARAVLFTGHFADEQLALIDDLVATGRAAGRPMDVVALGVNRCPVASLDPDHAGIFETSLLWAFWPDRVQIEALPQQQTHPVVDPGGDERGAHRHDPDDPLYGIFGPDPRGFDREQSVGLADTLVTWLAHAATDRPSG